MTTQQIAARFAELAREEKWFEIQDELFAEDVVSIEPAGSPYFKNEQGKGAVRKKGEEWVARVRGVNRLYTTEPVVAGDHFVVGREVDIEVEGHGRVVIDQLMVYAAKGGKIVKEEFFY